MNYRVQFSTTLLINKKWSYLAGGLLTHVLKVGLIRDSMKIISIANEITIENDKLPYAVR